MNKCTSNVTFFEKRASGPWITDANICPLYRYNAVMNYLASFIFAVCSTVFLFCANTAQAADTICPIAFPTDPAKVTFTDDFGQQRAGHAHEGIDLLGPKMTPLYAAVDGRVSYLVDPEASWGYGITLRDNDGYTYHYIHINNDTPGSDDGQGGTANAYAAGIYRGATVTKGQLIGWMGDSGNAENITSHLHFEIRIDDEAAINPYPSLIAALGPTSYNVSAASASSGDINEDKGLVPYGVPAACASGSLVKSKSSSAVYYCGANGKRYAFPHERVYFTWYTDFKNVKTITDAELASLPLGGNVTYRPGSRLVKLESIPNVYAVEKGGVLRWIQSPAVAAQLYGSNWSKKVDDLSDAFFTNYRLGDAILTAL